MTTQNLFRTADAITNADVIFEAAKRLKAAKTRLGNKADKEQEARDAVRTLQLEANAATTAMVNDEDMRDHRDLADIQRDLKSANTKLDRAIENAHKDKEAISEALDELVMFLEGDNMPEVNIDPGLDNADDDQEAA